MRFDEDFSDFYDFWQFSFLRIAPCSKGGLKTNAKKSVKRGARVAQVIPCGSLKEEENKASNIRKKTKARQILTGGSNVP